jgi:hypothetical protein
MDPDFQFDQLIKPRLSRSARSFVSGFWIGAAAGGMVAWFVARARARHARGAADRALRASSPGPDAGGHVTVHIGRDGGSRPIDVPLDWPGRGL